KLTYKLSQVNQVEVSGARCGSQSCDAIAEPIRIARQDPVGQYRVDTMNTTRGLRGSLQPPYPFKDLVEDLSSDGLGFPIHIEGGIIEVGYASPDEETRARQAVHEL